MTDLLPAKMQLPKKTTFQKLKSNSHNTFFRWDMGIKRLQKTAHLNFINLLQ